MTTITKIRKIRNVPKLKDVLDGHIFCQKTLCVIYVLKLQTEINLMVMTPDIMITYRKIKKIMKSRSVLQLQGGSWWTFGIKTSHVLYIFGNLWWKPIVWWWLQASWQPSPISGRSGMSPNLKDVIDGFFLVKRPYMLYIFWNFR